MDFLTAKLILCTVLLAGFVNNNILTQHTSFSDLSASQRTLLLVDQNTSTGTLVALNGLALLAVYKYWFLRWACTRPFVQPILFILGDLCGKIMLPALPVVTIPPRPRYTIVTQVKLNWMEAHVYCKLNGSELTTVESQEEFDELIALVEGSALTIPRSDYSFWTAGNDIFREGTFTWVSTGEPIMPFPFLPPGNSQPNNAGGVENCVHFWDLTGNMGYLLNDFDCTAPLHFICKDRI